ncbi:unnamed protein product [Peronospora belbahrii]|uniref:Pseudouridine synthase RsuA/RluA-like domain-containing protein n=2 Tax=Peronospora belbahrii TaxID=622444 RepID=A0ABN8DAL3_9STRA|nr:unnamed protein product [Peronospora belbahrii]
MWRQEFRWMRHVIRAQDHEMRLDVVFEGSIVSIDVHSYQSIVQSIGHKTEQMRELEETVRKRKKKTRRNDWRQCLLYENQAFLILNKPYGLAVQSSSWLIESLDQYLPSIAKSFTDKSDPLQQDKDEQQTSKVVHRLDMNTSGVLVLARSRLAAAKFFQLLRHGAVQKTYEALVSAATSPLSSDNNYSMLKFEDERLNTM